MHIKNYTDLDIYFVQILKRVLSALNACYKAYSIALSTLVHVMLKLRIDIISKIKFKEFNTDNRNLCFSPYLPQSYTFSV